VVGLLKEALRDPLFDFALAVLALVFLSAALADYIAPYKYYEVELEKRLAKPSREHLLGTDHLGRDLLSRIVHGTRPLLYVIAASLAIAVPTGVLLGMAAGYFGGKADAFLSRFVDAMMALPTVLLALAIVAVLGPGLEKIAIAIGASEVPTFARLARSLVVTEKELLYVEAAKSIGASPWRILLRHIAPNVMSPIIVQATFSASTAVLWEAALSFLGLGAQPPTPSWGLMLYEAKGYMRQAPHVAVFPGLAIFLVVFSLNVVGEKVRDLLDPKTRAALK